jgi:3-oxoacyl-[acyl-carrier protein] reductase
MGGPRGGRLPVRLEGKVAIVTGAAAGIGRAVAERFGREGAAVVVADVDETGARAVATDIEDAGGRALAVGCDVSDEAAVDRLFAACAEAFGPLDAIVTNAALTATERHFLEADRAWWDAIVAVNLTGTFHCALRAARVMAPRRRGAIITVSSGAAQRAHRGNAAYDATKGGIDAFTRALALDLGPYGIRVNGIVPGSIDSKGMPADLKAERGQTIPLGRVGEPSDLAAAALFLASDDASYVSGHMLLVDGGLLAQQRSPQVDIFPLSRYPEVPVEG